MKFLAMHTWPSLWKPSLSHFFGDLLFSKKKKKKKTIPLHMVKNILWKWYLYLFNIDSVRSCQRLKWMVEIKHWCWSAHNSILTLAWLSQRSGCVQWFSSSPGGVVVRRVLLETLTWMTHRSRQECLCHNAQRLHKVILLMLWRQPKWHRAWCEM